MDKIVEQKIIEGIKKILEGNGYVQENLSDIEIKNIIKSKLIIFIKENGLRLSVNRKKELIDKIFDSIERLDILQSLIENEEISEIMINGSDNIFVNNGGEIRKTDIKFQNNQVLKKLIQKMILTVNIEAALIIDTRLKDGLTVNVILPPIALNGPIVTIKKPVNNPLAIEKMIEIESISKEAANFLKNLVMSKYNILVSGDTRTGKTTLLNILSNYIPKDERIVTIENLAELQIDNAENLIRLVTNNTSGTKEVTIRDLIKNSLKMRPDRIVVGEIGKLEAFDIIQIMNTGYDGILTTGQANSARDMISKLETMIFTEYDFPISVVKNQISSAFDFIVHIGRGRDKKRKVLQITEVVGVEEGKIILNPIYELVEEEGDTGEAMIESLCRTKNELRNIKKVRGYLE